MPNSQRKTLCIHIGTEEYDFHLNTGKSKIILLYLILQDEYENIILARSEQLFTIGDLQTEGNDIVLHETLNCMSAQ